MIKTRAKQQAKPVDTPPNDQGGEPLWVEVANDQRVDIKMVGREMVVSPHVPKAGRGRPASGKELMTIRLDAGIIDKFRATGPGWQSRIDQALRDVKIIPSGEKRNKTLHTLRLDPTVIAKFKATGPGWQQRINDVLMGVKL